MKFFLAAAALLCGAQAAVVTQVVHVTQYVYEDVHVFVDGQGNPVSTAVSFVQGTVGAGSSAPASHIHTEVAPVSIQVSTAPASSAPAAPPASAPPASSAPASSAPASAPPASSAPAPAPPASSAPASAPPASSAPAPAPPAPSSSPASAPAPASSAAPAPTTSSEPAPAPTTSAAPSPEPTTSSAPAPAPSSSSGGSGGSFQGDGTYYDIGLGACGWTNSDSELVAALNWEQFGSQSNGNPVCGKYAKVNSNGKTATVKIVDKCPGCKYGDLDLSPAAFNQLASESEGRIKIDWSFQ